MQTTPLTEAAIGWLEKRGIDVETAARYGVSSVVPTRRTNDVWVAFPHEVRGEAVHWTARVISTPKPQAWTFQKKGGQRCLWNQDVVFDKSLQSQAPLIITEGHLDALAFMSVGYRAVCSVPDGAPSKPSVDDPAPKSKYAYLADIRDELHAWRSIIVATDNDGPGHALFEDLVRIVGRSRCRVIDYPGRAKDANQALMEYGSEQLVQAVEGARWCHVGGIYQLDELPKLQLTAALGCGISGVDQVWRFRTGEMSVLTGVPSHGKTMMANNIGIGMAENHQWVVGFFSPEQDPSIHVDRLLTLKLRRRPENASEEEVDEAKRWIAGHVVWIREEDDREATIEWMDEKVAAAAWRYNLRMVVIDPWNQMCHSRMADINGHEYVGEALRLAHRRCRESSIHMLINAHPHKPSNRESENVKAPHGYAISDSSHFVNRPDLGATLHRYEDHSLFWCWKARYADGEWYDNGRAKSVKLKFDMATRRFSAKESLSTDRNGFLL